MNVLTLTRRDRRLCAFAGALLSCGALALAPLAGRSAAGPSGDEVVPIRSEALALLRETRVSFGTVADPFARALPGGELRPSPPAPAPTGHRIARTPQDLPKLRAVVVGEHAYALVEDGGSARIVSIGDTLGATRVVSIEMESLTLGDGRRLSLDGTAH